MSILEEWIPLKCALVPSTAGCGGGTTECKCGYGACRLPDYCSSSMLSVHIQGPKSWINLYQQSRPASKMLHLRGWKSASLSLCSLLLYHVFILPPYLPLMLNCEWGGGKCERTCSWRDWSDYSCFSPWLMSQTTTGPQSDIEMLVQPSAVLTS